MVPLVLVIAVGVACVEAVGGKRAALSGTVTPLRGDGGALQRSRASTDSARSSGVTGVPTTIKDSGAVPEAVAVPYPAPANWSHAWPFDATTSVSIDPRVVVQLNPASALDAVQSSTPTAVDPLINTILSRYQTLLRNKVSAAPRFRQAATAMPVITTVVVTVVGPNPLTLGPDTNESYVVKVALDDTGAATATVTAETAFGAKHGLESLAQLVSTPTGMVAGVNSTVPLVVVDEPVWPYRAVMLDTGRHYLSIETIQKTIDGMAALKLNVLHWHILDSTSFPVQSLKFPQLSAKGAYSSLAVYSLDDLRLIVAYARSRAVRVVPEIEMPGHGSFSAGMPELSLTSCSDVLDVTKDSTYTFIASFLSEMASVFDDNLIMLGGDEVGFDPNCSWPGQRVCGYHCFDRDPEVATWMTVHNMTSSQMNDYFWSQITARVVPTLTNKTVGVWMADTPNGAGKAWPAPHMNTLPPGSVANVYQSMKTAVPLLDQGVDVVLSVADSQWYLDYHPDFATVYSVRPCDPNQLDCDANPDRRAHLLGGSVSQWGESVDAFNLNPNIWVGASALAERLWTDFPLWANATNGAADAEQRHHNLQCHWAMWGHATYTREKKGSEFTAVADASLSNLCPADWCSTPV